MSTATARAYQPYFAGRFVSFEMRKIPQNKAFYGYRSTYSGKAHCIKDSVLLDAGCGTGILSVIASKLGASDVLALDIDPEAVAATENNAKINGCGNITAREGDLLKGVEYEADMVIANLLAPLVMELSGEAPAVCGKGAVLVASGIIDDMEERCMKAVETNGFRIIDVMRDDCWTAFAAVLEK